MTKDDGDALAGPGCQPDGLSRSASSQSGIPIAGKARPIIFSAPMVRALLAGEKTQTRRLLKPRRTRPSLLNGGWSDSYVLDPGNAEWLAQEYPYRVGDRLYVREAFSYDALDCDRDGTLPPWCWADGNPEDGDWSKPKPSIHMPRWASRLTLHVEDVRVQRLQECSVEDAIAEGAKCWICDGPVNGTSENDCSCFHSKGEAIQSYSFLWDTIHGDGSWDTNPWIVAVTFRVEHGNIDRLAQGISTGTAKTAQPVEGEACEPGAGTACAPRSAS